MCRVGKGVQVCKHEGVWIWSRYKGVDVGKGANVKGEGVDVKGGGVG